MQKRILDTCWMEQEKSAIVIDSNVKQKIEFAFYIPNSRELNIYEIEIVKTNWIFIK